MTPLSQSEGLRPRPSHWLNRSITGPTKAASPGAAPATQTAAKLCKKVTLTNQRAKTLAGRGFSRKVVNALRSCLLNIRLTSAFQFLAITDLLQNQNFKFLTEAHLHK